MGCALRISARTRRTVFEPSLLAQVWHNANTSASASPRLTFWRTISNGPEANAEGHLVPGAAVYPAEEAECYRRMSGGPVTVVKPAAAPKEKPQPQPPEE
jgi:hypothetical protein